MLEKPKDFKGDVVGLDDLMTDKIYIYFYRRGTSCARKASQIGRRKVGFLINKDLGDKVGKIFSISERVDFFIKLNKNVELDFYRFMFANHLVTNK